MSSVKETREKIIEVTHLKNKLGGQWVHEDINLAVYRGEILAIIGGSGCGKTTLLRSILQLIEPTGGEITVFGLNLMRASRADLLLVQKRWGVMFQSGALFSSLNVLENVMFELNEYTTLSRDMKKMLAKIKIVQSGLSVETADKYPSELSGGMRKRAALARAIALDPELIFLDEPTAGLDPKSAGDLDDLLLELRKALGLTFVMVTHDLDTLWTVPDRVVFIGDGRVLAAKPMHELVEDPHPLIRLYFSNPRAMERR